ncbi:Reverse transcriptase domain-containing protein [Aphis craccivora]|uniref:Reverse transcriptase domain-containing protein n=1 Tax=Aphis craccivora TaxID=307492 RepID=A0A6G0WD34_APHCR|nr:Reverse transcriptase domain-containing protein [Aphis craccivora]
MSIFKSITWFTIITSSYTNVFIAYDCSGPKLNITSFNSLQVDYCEQPPLPSSRQVPRIKLLQRAEIRTIFYRSCLISVDYLITRCSAFDDSQVVEGGFFSEILILGAARCAELHQKQAYLFPTGGMVAGLKINQTITATHTLIGTLDREGNCQGASYSSDRGTWKNVVVQCNYKIYLGEGIANSQTKDNILIMPTGTRLKLSELYGLDTFKGEVIWSNDQILQSCDRSDFDVLYDGPASIIIADKKNPSSHETHTYMVESENIVFALKKIKKTFACEIPVIQTEHPQLYILIDSSFVNQFQTKQILPYNTDLMAYVNTKFVYIENFLRTTMTSLYADLLNKQCELERKMIIQKLSLASHSLSEFAYAMGEGPGYTAMNAGEIIYLLKCKAVNVEINTLKT